MKFILDTLHRFGYDDGKPCDAELEQQIKQIRFTAMHPVRRGYQLLPEIEILYVGRDWFLTKVTENRVPKFDVHHVHWQSRTLKWMCEFTDFLDISIDDI